MDPLREAAGADRVAGGSSAGGPSLTRLDIWASLATGLASAGLLQFLVRVWGLPNPFVQIASLALVAGPAAALAVVGLGIRLGKHWPPLTSASKFVVVGVLNTLIDLAILNLLMQAAGITRGPLFVLFKVLSFAVAVVNGFLWNQRWTFASCVPGAERKPALRTQFTLFTTVTVIGIGLNAGVAGSLVEWVQPGPLLSPLQWANVAAGMALVVSSVWNFWGYRFLVFAPRRQ